MKSISIVYKRPKTLRESDRKKEEQADMRTTANQYYTKLLQRSLNREQIIEKIRSKTALASKLLDRKNVFSSLSIASISTPQPTPTLSKSSTEKKLPSNSIFNIKKPKAEHIFSLKLPDHDKDYKIDYHLLRRASTKQVMRHAKMKILSKIKCEKDVTFIISIDFIYDQFNFWGEEFIQEGCMKTWRLLQPLANIIWIVRSEVTARKLTIFTQNKGLRLDGILQIEPNKKQTLTISYATLEQQVKFQRGHKVLIVNCIKNDTPQLSQIPQLQFRSSLPVLSHSSTFVHFIRVDMNNKYRFNAIKKIVTQQLPKPFDLTKILQDYRNKKGKFLNSKKLNQNYLGIIQSSNINIAEKMETIKNNLLAYCQQSFGLKTRLEGDSLSYVIGDMLKRNYAIAKEYFAYCSEIQQKEQGKQLAFVDNFMGSSMKKFEYNRPVYVWQS